MKAKPVIPRVLANQDVEAAVDYYLSEDAEQAALGFIDALEKAYAHIARHPASGSSRYAHELDLPGLHCWPLKRYPTWFSTSSATTTSMCGAYSTA